MIIPVPPKDVASSIIYACSSLINGYFQRKQAQQFEIDRKAHDLRVIEIKKQIEIENSERKARNDRLLEGEKHQNQLKLELQKSELKMRMDRGGSPYLSGEWKKNRIPDQPEPYIIFSTNLRQNHNRQDNYLGYNPIMGIYTRIQKQIGHAASVIETAEGFYGEDEVRHFINREFPQNSVVVIYGDYQGKDLFIRATYRGMSKEQFIVYSNGETLMTPGINTVILGEMPKPAQGKDLDLVAARDTEEFIYYLIANVWLQVLIDSYYMFFPEKHYAPQSHIALLNKLEYFERFGLQDKGQELFELTNKSSKEFERIRQDTILLRLKS